MIFNKERTQERKRQLELETAVEKAVKTAERKGQLELETAVEKAVEKATENAERKCKNDFIASLIKKNVMTLERIATLVGVPISEVRGINTSVATNTDGTQVV